MRKVKQGTGITARDVLVVESDEDAEVVFKAQEENRREGGGAFGGVSLRAARICERILGRRSPAPGVYCGPAPREDSIEEFAQKVGGLIGLSKRTIAEGNADKAALYAWMAGMEWARAQMKWASEVDALRGQKVADGQREGARQTNARHALPREKRFAVMAELVPKVGVEEAARRCANIKGMGTQTQSPIKLQAAIKRQWNDWQKKSGRPRPLSRR
jgi:hypothetical protein